MGTGFKRSCWWIFFCHWRHSYSSITVLYIPRESCHICVHLPGSPLLLFPSLWDSRNIRWHPRAILTESVRSPSFQSACSSIDAADDLWLSHSSTWTEVCWLPWLLLLLKHKNQGNETYTFHSSVDSLSTFLNQLQITAFTHSYLSPQLTEFNLLHCRQYWTKNSQTQCENLSASDSLATYSSIFILCLNSLFSHRSLHVRLRPP